MRGPGPGVKALSVKALLLVTLSPHWDPGDFKMTLDINLDPSGWIWANSSFVVGSGDILGHPLASLYLV